MTITLTIPDHRPVVDSLSALDEDKARLLTAWRVIDALALASANRLCPVESVVNALDEEDFEPAPGAFERLRRENEELRDTLDDIRRTVA